MPSTPSEPGEPIEPGEAEDSTEPDDAGESFQRIVDSLTLRFDGQGSDGSALHELRASHVAEVLQGLVGLTHDFDQAGVFNGDGPANSEVLVRPAQEGSFVIEVIRIANELLTNNAVLVTAVTGAMGFPTLGKLLEWATKSARADVKAATHDKDTGLTQITWQDDTMDEVPTAVFEELNVRKRRRKKHLRQIMAPLSDPRVTSLDVTLSPAVEGQEAPKVLALTQPDYDAVKPEDDVTEKDKKFTREAQMSAVDFDNPRKWKVKTKDETRTAVMDDKDFLAKIAGGLAIRKDDIFRLKIRANTKTKNGRSRTTWTVVKVKEHRRAAGDSDS
jgi:hypothetical protein